MLVDKIAEIPDKHPQIAIISIGFGLSSRLSSILYTNCIEINPRVVLQSKLLYLRKMFSVSFISLVYPRRESRFSHPLAPIYILLDSIPDSLVNPMDCNKPDNIERVLHENIASDIVVTNFIIHNYDKLYNGSCRAIAVHKRCDNTSHTCFYATLFHSEWAVIAYNEQQQIHIVGICPNPFNG